MLMKLKFQTYGRIQEKDLSSNFYKETDITHNIKSLITI